MMWIVVTLLTIAVPVFFGISVINAIDRFFPHEQHRILNKTLTLTVESLVLVTPCCIHCLFGFVTPYACMWIAVGTIVVFVFALFLQYGNDVESCVVVLIIAILVPEIVISGEWAIDAYQEKRQDEVTTGALNTDKSMNQIVGRNPDHSEMRDRESFAPWLRHHTRALTSGIVSHTLILACPELSQVRDPGSPDEALMQTAARNRGAWREVAGG